MARNVETLGELLRDVQRGFFEATQHIVRDQGISAPGMRVMGHVMEYPGTTVTELSRKKRFAKSHISHAVDYMVGAGFIEKRSDPSDQRLVRLYPTDKAKQHFEGVHAAVHDRMTEILSVLSDDQLKVIIDALTILRSAMRCETTKEDRS